MRQIHKSCLEEALEKKDFGINDKLRIPAIAVTIIIAFAYIGFLIK